MRLLLILIIISGCAKGGQSNNASETSTTVSSEKSCDAFVNEEGLTLYTPGRKCGESLADYTNRTK